MFISRHTLKWTKTCRSSGDFPHAHTAHFLLNRHTRQGQGPARPRTRGRDAGQTRRAAAPRDDGLQPRGDAQEAHPQGRTSRTGASGRHHRARNPQDRQARLRHAEQHRRQTPDLQPRQAQRRTHGRTAHRPRPGRRRRPGDRRDPRRPDARRHPRIPIPQAGERCQRCPTTDVKHASGDPSTMPQDITVLPLISLVT